MFCIYEDTVKGGWNAELVYSGRAKVSAHGDTPYESLEKLFGMINDDDQTGNIAEIDGTKSLPSSIEYESADGTRRVGGDGSCR